MPESRGDAFSTGGRHPITPVSSTEGIIWIETRFAIKEAKPVSVHLLPGSPSPTPDPLPPLTGSIWHATGTDAGAAPDASLVQAEPLTPARRVSQDFGSAPIVPSLSLCSHFAWVLTETWCMPFTSGHDCRAGADVHESSSSGRASARYIFGDGLRLGRGDPRDSVQLVPGRPGWIWTWLCQFVAGTPLLL